MGIKRFGSKVTIKPATRLAAGSEFARIDRIKPPTLEGLPYGWVPVYTVAKGIGHDAHRPSIIYYTVVRKRGVNPGENRGHVVFIGTEGKPMSRFDVTDIHKLPLGHVKVEFMIKPRQSIPNDYGRLISYSLQHHSLEIPALKSSDNPMLSGIAVHRVETSSRRGNISEEEPTTFFWHHKDAPPTNRSPLMRLFDAFKRNW